jgi:hypothetical protein
MIIFQNPDVPSEEASQLYSDLVEDDTDATIAKAAAEAQLSLADDQVSKRVSDSVLDLIALLVNKWKATLQDKPATNVGESVLRLRPELLMTPLTIVREAISNLRHVEPLKGARCVRMAVICTMAANLKGATKVAAELMMMLVDGLQVPAYNRAIAINFELLMKPSDILTKDNHAVIRGLSSSRPFGICVPKIQDLYRTKAKAQDSVAVLHDTSKQENEQIKTNCLVALISIVKYTPSETVMDVIEDLFPMILLCLDGTGSTAQQTALDTISKTIEKKPEIIEEHLWSVIKSLLTKIVDTKRTHIPVREKSLVVLGQIALSGRLQTKCRPHKRDVGKVLDKAVADPDRMGVRKEAVKCRATWINMVMQAGVQADD